MPDKWVLMLSKESSIYDFFTEGEMSSRKTAYFK